MSAAAQDAFLFGDPHPMEVHFQSRSQSYSRRQAFPGFYGFIRDWDIGGTYTDTELCPTCHGARLRPAYLASTLAGHNFHALCQMDLSKLAESIADLSLCSSLRGRIVLPIALIEASQQTLLHRLRFLELVGLAYLNLDRLTATLSAGEAQRIRLASLLGGELSGLTVLLDEPSRGLHPSEVQALLEALRQLRDQGNCIIVIEHDLSIIRAADHLIDIGPGAGTGGGSIVAQGAPADVASGETFTGLWLRKDRRLTRSQKETSPADWLTVHGARENNLSGQTVRFPRRRLVGVCGVSGSGKSTLLVDTMGRALAPKTHTTSVASEPMEPGCHDGIEGAPARTVIVDQARAGISSPASFLGLDRPLRKIYAESEQAQELGLALADFNRNCTPCKGRGMTRIDLDFLPAVRARCETCNGTGYGPQAWQTSLAGLTLPELFQLTVSEFQRLMEAHESFDQPNIRRPVAAAIDAGLGYLVLRQPGHALSGGEAQRLKIARELRRKSKDETLYILDEPSVGQHMQDLQRLVDVLGRLVDDGHSVIVIEHEPAILAVADWLVELGPGGGPSGGRVVFTGTPRDLATGDTPMAPYLKDVLSSKKKVGR